MSSPIIQAIEQICDEKGLPKDKVIETIEAALAAAYKKDNQAKDKNVKVEFDEETGATRVFDEKEVVEDMDLEKLEEKRLKLREKKEAALDKGNEELVLELSEKEQELPRFHMRNEIMLSEAKELKKSAKIGTIIKTELPVTEEYGRMAAQTAKQVIIQRLREVERDIIFDEFKDYEGEIVSGVVQRQEGNVFLVDLNRTTGVMPVSESIRGEHYKPGNRMQFFVKEVRLGGRGAEIYLSRSHPEMIRKMFELEVPEITNDVVEIKSIAREAGSRSKIAVYTDQENIDPVGSCVGQRGTRVQTVINELGGEKIDVIEWNENSATFIAQALSPAQIIRVDVDEEEQTAKVLVREDQLSLAIGKAGQNVRLAAKLTGWKIDIASDEGTVISSEEDGEVEEEEAVATEVTLEEVANSVANESPEEEKKPAKKVAKKKAVKKDIKKEEKKPAKKVAKKATKKVVKK